MNPFYPIYTKKTECLDCYKCVRACPVKAIQVVDGSASVINDRCIACGNCIEICPAGAKHVRSDIDRIKRFLTLKDRVIVSLAPSFVTEFKECSKAQLIAAIKKLGFADVSETALGAQLVSKTMATILDNGKSNIMISSACPTIVSLIKKYYPQYSEYVADLYSPLLSHCKLLKENFGNDIGIVFVGPCISKKLESDSNNNLLDVAITFEELREWFELENIKLDEITLENNPQFVPFEATNGGLYPIDGGMLEGIKEFAKRKDVHYMAFSGMPATIDALDNISNYKSTKPIVLELLACKGGCVNGPKSNSRKETILKRLDIEQFVSEDKNINDWQTQPEIIYGNPVDTVFEDIFSNDEIDDMLNKIGKFTAGDELNCSSCGYDTCRDFAQALLSGIAEKSMCASYMRKLATKRANKLLKTMPSGVVIVNDKLQIVECNQNFSKLLGGDVESVFEAIPGLEGASLEKLVPFADYFKHVLETGEDLLNKQIPYKTGGLIGSIFSIESHGFVGGIFQSAKIPALHQQDAIKKTRSVIEKNLAVVQQIAYLLGENASETEMVLESIIQSLSYMPKEDE